MKNPISSLLGKDYLFKGDRSVLSAELYGNIHARYWPCTSWWSERYPFKLIKFFPWQSSSLIILFSLYTTSKVRRGAFKQRFVFFFPPLCKKALSRALKSRGSPPASLYEYLKMEKHFITKYAKKERKTEVFLFFTALD